MPGNSSPGTGKSRQAALGVCSGQPTTGRGGKRETGISWALGEGEASPGKEETGEGLRLEGETDPAQSSEWLPAACV